MSGWLTSLLAFALVSFSVTSGSLAETVRPAVKKSTSTTTITTTTIESDGIDDDETAPAPETTQTTDDNEIKTTFGSTATTGMAGCKTEELLKNVISDLKSDCSAWLKDQKSQLRDKYITGTCEEQCSDCQMNMRRCSVTGAVRYTKSTIKK